MKNIIYDIGGTTVKWAIVDSNLNIGDRGSFKTFTTTYEENPNRVRNDLYKRIIDHINEMKKYHELYKVGISSACIVDVGTGEVHGENSIFKGYTEINVYDEIWSGTGLKCIAMNDGNSAVLAEYAIGASKGIESSVLIVLGTGIGAGVISEGKILKGHNYWAGEVGFMMINGEYWEDLASTVNFTKKVSEKIGKEVNGYYVFQNLDNKIIYKEYKDWIKNIAIGVANIFHVYGPEIILLGGGVSAEEKFDIKDIMEEIKKIVSEKIYESINIQKAKLGNDANILGVASLIK